MVAEIQQMTFDYDSLDANTRVFVQEKAQAIHTRLKRTAEDVIAIGQDLTEVNAVLAPLGKFHNWIRSEFDMTRQTAYRFMNVATRFGGCNKLLQLNPSPSALYALADASEEVIEKVQSGKIPPTYTAIQELKRVDPASLPVLKPEPGPIYGPVYQQPIPTAVYAPSIPTLHTSDTDEGGSTVRTPVEIDRVSHDDDPLEEAKEKRDAHVMRVMGSSDSPEWYTPQDIVQLSIELLGEIALDPCSNSHESPNVPANEHYTKEDNGLLQPWKGKVYLNPPYGSEIPQWVEKLVNSYGHGVTEAIALLPARIDTLWFQPLYEFPMCNVRGRLQFSNSPHSAPFPSVVVYLGDRIDDFIRVFGRKGPIMKKVGGK